MCVYECVHTDIHTDRKHKLMRQMLIENFELCCNLLNLHHYMRPRTDRSMQKFATIMQSRKSLFKLIYKIIQNIIDKSSLNRIIEVCFREKNLCSIGLIKFLTLKFLDSKVFNSSCSSDCSLIINHVSFSSGTWLY